MARFTLRNKEKTKSTSKEDPLIEDNTNIEEDDKQ